MKKVKLGLLLTIVAVLSGLMSCNLKKKEKVTDIPVTTSSKDALASVRQGLAQMDQGDYLKARTLFIKATEQDPKLAIAYLLQTTENLTSPAEFRELLDKAKAGLEGVSYWEKMYYNMYMTYATSDWKERLEIVKKIDSAYPDAPRALVDLGFVYADGNDVAHSRDCLLKALSMDTSWTGGYYSCASSYLYYEPKDFKKAEEFTLKLVKLAPASAGAEILLGDCYRAENDLQKARDAYAKAITLDPSSPDGYYKKGHANTFLGNFEEARQDYTNGAKQDQSLTEANNLIGYTYLYAGDYKKALDYISGQAAKVDQSNEPAGKKTMAKYNYYINSFFIAFHYGDKKAVKDLIAGLEPLSIQLGKDIGTSQTVLEQKGYILYLKALQDVMEGKLDAAKSKAGEIKTTLEPINDPNKLSNYEMVMGQICMKEKKYDDAAGYFLKAQQTQIYTKYWLAMAYDAAGKKDKADGLFREISIHNFNELDYALVRNQVNEMLAKESAKKKKK